ALQYRLADALLPNLRIDQATGWLYPDASPPEAGPADTFVPPPRGHPEWDTELVVFVLLGRSPRGGVGRGNAPLFQPSFAEIHHEGKLLGRSYTLGDTVDLAYTTEQKEAASKLAKTASRVVLKEVIAGSVQSATDNEALGDLVRMILIELMEHPDTRRWETLPRWLQVARVPCPPDLRDYEVIFRDGTGTVLGSLNVSQPLTRYRDTFVSFCRDIQLRSEEKAQLE
ncbi:MAG: hypothetical protein KJ626_13450, partial [Verrucomicrobia bacterium]|nr:hypothetical protein [Verrucomicrobiota bacterium]